MPLSVIKLLRSVFCKSKDADPSCTEKKSPSNEISSSLLEPKPPGKLVYQLFRIVLKIERKPNTPLRQYFDHYIQSSQENTSPLPINPELDSLEQEFLREIEPFCAV